MENASGDATWKIDFGYNAFEHACNLLSARWVRIKFLAELPLMPVINSQIGNYAVKR